MLSHLASLSRFSAKRVSLSRAQGSRDEARRIPLSTRFSSSLSARFLHSSLKLEANGGFKDNNTDIISMVIPALETKVSEQYWPSSAESTSSEPSQAPPPDHQDLDALDRSEPSFQSSNRKRYNEKTERSKIPSSYSPHRDFEHKRNPKSHHGSQEMTQERQNARQSTHERENDGTRKWQAIRLQTGPTPSLHPRQSNKAHGDEDLRSATPSRPHTSHLTEKSIYLRQSITQAITEEAYLRECELYQQSPNFDVFTFEVSRLTRLEKRNADLAVRMVHVDSLLSHLFSEMTQLLSKKRSNPDFQPTYSGEKLDLALSLISSSIFDKTSDLMEVVVEFLEVDGKFDPPVLPSSWRRLWTSVAHLVSRHGFMKPDYQKMCEISVAVYNYIYMNQYEMCGHTRKSENQEPLKPIYLPRSPPLSKVDGTPRSSKTLMNVELPEMKLSAGEAPLLRGPQAVSAMLAILSQVSGHVRLKRLIVDLYGRMVLEKSAFPPRRIIPLAGLLFSWGEFEAGRAGLTALQSYHPSEIDVKSSEYELSALKYLMVCNNASALLDFAESMTQVPGHIPSPLSLTHIVWAIQQTQQYGRVMPWWHTVAKIWRAIPSQTQRGDSKIHLLVRCPIPAVIELLDIATEHLTAQDLQEISQDFTDIFGIRPAGSRSRIIGKYASDGNVEEAIAALGSFTLPRGHMASRPSDPASSSPFIMSSKIVLAMIKGQKFDERIEDLLDAIVRVSSGPFSPGLLVNHVCSMHEEVVSHEEALKWVSFLRWVASLPMPDGSLPALAANLLHPSSEFTHKLVEESRVKYPDHDKTMAQLVTISARSVHRLADIAGLAGISSIVSSFIARMNMQFMLTNQGQTMPFSAVWLRPLVQAHAFEGNADTVYKLLASLKSSMLPSEREGIWKAAFKAYCKARNTQCAVNLIVNIRNKTIDDQIPTWSGGYTMTIQLMLAQQMHAEALQMYALMISDGFELRARSIVLELIQYLRNLTTLQKEQSNSMNDFHQIQQRDEHDELHAYDHHELPLSGTHHNLDEPLSQTSSEPIQQLSQDIPSVTTGNANYDSLLNRLVLLEPTLDDSKPMSRLAPGKNLRRRHAKERIQTERVFISKLDRAIHPSSSRNFSSAPESL
jgi:hypothetical protein